MTIIKILFATCLSCLCLKAVLAADINRGKVHYQTCSGCHGEHAQGNPSLNAPLLAGQRVWYLEKQLMDFKTGIRGSDPDDLIANTMLPFAQGLQNQDIKDVSAFLATLPVPTQKKPQNASVNAGNKQNGYRYYQSKCGACHGELGQGNSAFKAPRLTGLSAVYLQRQMDHFRTGVRGAHHADKLGRQMAMMAKLTSGQDLADILLYLEQQ